MVECRRLSRFPAKMTLVPAQKISKVSIYCDDKASFTSFYTNRGWTSWTSATKKSIAQGHQGLFQGRIFHSCSFFSLLGASAYSEAGLTNFTKVRLDLSTMTLVADDFHYSTTSSGKKIKYGEAGDCFSASKEYCRKGEFKIDLTGTGFRLKASFLTISTSYEK